MMPEVKNCAVQECFYNIGEICHAAAIMVGALHPSCDTFIDTQGTHGKNADQAGVGACHVGDCKWNERLSCEAPSINVDYHDTHADCYTYEPISYLEDDIDRELLDQTQTVTFEGSTSSRVDQTSGEEMTGDTMPGRVHPQPRA